MSKKNRMLISRLGMDAHWRGSIVVAKALSNAGMEVIYGGNQMPEKIVDVAIQEDVDVIGLSSLSGNHMILAPEVIELLKSKGADDIMVVFGGTVPPDDVPKLKEAGIAEVFGSGTSLNKIVGYFREQGYL